MAAAGGAAGGAGSSHVCSHCGSTFASKSKLFQHLRGSACTSAAVESGLEVPAACEKVALLIGCKAYDEEWRSHLWKAIDEARSVGSSPTLERYADLGGAPGAVFASDAHGVEVLFQEGGAPSVCDVLSLKTEALAEEQREEWCQKANAALPSSVRILGRSMPLCKDFNADAACQRRIYECFVPLSMLAPGLRCQEQYVPKASALQMGYRKLDTTNRNWKFPELAKLKTVMRSLQGSFSFHNFATSARLGPGDSVSRRSIFKLRLRVEPDKDTAVFTVEADALLKGQFRSIVGLLIAIQRNLLPESYIEAALQDQHLLEVPELPEGTVLLERCVYPNKYHYLLQPVMDSAATAEWRLHVFQQVQQALHRGRLETWFDDELTPQCHLLAVALQAKTSAVPQSLDVNSVDTPLLYGKMLSLLRDAEASGRWPSIGTGREKVIKASTLAEHGGSGGSFSVGSMPGHLGTPAGNRLFPELAECAFHLERLLMPDRRPSSTIAVNRHAQFLPHVDSGAGAGQGISLIVGLGDYAGGELVVEGEVFDIRYKPREFRGWVQRHWTKPFEGERFSLVWFTPCGCEDMPGINLSWDVSSNSTKEKDLLHHQEESKQACSK